MVLALPFLKSLRASKVDCYESVSTFFIFLPLKITCRCETLENLSCDKHNIYMRKYSIVIKACMTVHRI